MVGAGLNVVPTALVAMGIGALLLAVAPRRAAGAVYAVVVWSLLVDLLGSIVANLRWLEHLSLFHYMALAPAQDTDPRTMTITLAVVIVLCVAATFLFARRDVQSE
jgi:ABC-2 type transport system permease protein